MAEGREWGQTRACAERETKTKAEGESKTKTETKTNGKKAVHGLW